MLNREPSLTACRLEIGHFDFAMRMFFRKRASISRKTAGSRGEGRSDAGVG